MKKLNLFIIYFISLIYLEFLLRILVLDKVFALSNVNMILFLIPVSLFLTLITKIGKEKINKITFFVIMIFNYIWFGANYVLKTFFGFYLTFEALGLSDQIANGFMKDAVIQVIARLGGLLFLAVPLIVSIILKKKINFKKMKKNKLFSYIILITITFIIYYLSLFLGKGKEYSPYVLFHEVNNPEANIEKVGVTNTIFIDTYRKIFGFEEKIIIEKKEKKKEEPKEIVYDYNTLNIDFESLLNNTSDSTIKNMTEYFMSDSGTLQNEYTGKFKGKNLILFMAESFNGVAISEELTPTLYKLANNGFVFKNFYTPTVYSTIGGEFQELSGLYAGSLDILTRFRSGNNYFPMGIATLFNNEGYLTQAYHDSFSTFQDRNKYLRSLGFNTFEGCESKENEMQCYPWPGSDVSMIDATYQKYINSETPFMVFYASVSGHGGYTSASAYYKKYKDLLDVHYPAASVESKAYVAGQMELDRALERLLQVLEENGKLDNTVIALVGDHAPYYLYEKSMSYINEISTYERDRKIELFHSNFILYNSQMENVEVTKVGSQIDVMPTLYNVFGLPYDSRLFIGKDILSTEPGLAIMSDNSWVSDEGSYVTSTGEFTQKSANVLEEDYVSNMNLRVKNKVTMSKNIITKNYYDKVFTR